MSRASKESIVNFTESLIRKHKMRLVQAEEKFKEVYHRSMECQNSDDPEERKLAEHYSDKFFESLDDCTKWVHELAELYRDHETIKNSSLR